MSHIDDLPPLRDVIDRHGLAAKKALGQNFLLDLNITLKIARTAGDLTGRTVLEIGPGPGGLTRALLASGAKRVVAIERDERCLPALAEISDAHPGRLMVVPGDALAVDHHAALLDAGWDPESEPPVKIIANLPYNIATPLFTNWITPKRWPPFWDGMAVMFQREVAERITADIEHRHWGRLGVLTSWRCNSAIAFDLPPQAFSPPPKVTSSVIMVEPKTAPHAVEVKQLERITQAAFGQRRKMLRQSLKSLGGTALLEKVGIEPTLRAENLTMDEFVTLANALMDDGDRG